ncbi:MAG: hypothetical protein ABR978_08250 [Dehalococcoidia bacterium]
MSPDPQASLVAGKQPLLPPSASGGFAKAPTIAMEEERQQQLIL